MTIHAPPPWKTKRIFSHQRREALAVLDAMRGGAVLMALGYDEWWVSSTGQVVGRTVAGLVCEHENVVGQGDGLFADCPQSWRWADFD
jgi:hypothetical protein